MELDLGAKAVINVSVDGKKHAMRMPTVIEAQLFQQKMKGAKDNDLELFCEFVDVLGMPKDVSSNLDIHQFKKLSEGLLGMAEKK